jgi:hypothetical protein
MLKTTLLLLLITFSCTAQTKVKREQVETDVCWSTPEYAPDGIRYVLLYRKYQVNDSVWKFLADADKNIATIRRPFFGKAELGVASVYNGDTSEIHSSLDSTACLESNRCNEPCLLSGPWFIYWSVSGPKFIRVKK